MLHTVFLAAVSVATAPAAAGVVSYPPTYFEAAAPTNAMEMVERLPGFTVDTGDSVRGFEGAAGNVLIDGQRPSSKSDNLEEILRRVPASQVARIDLIRGGAPGIDMQGQSVLANVVRKTDGGFRGLVAVSETLSYDGRHAPGVRLEGSGVRYGLAWEAAFVTGKGIDDWSGDGARRRLDPAGRPLITGFVDGEGGFTNTTLTAAAEAPLLGGKLRVNGRYNASPWDYSEVNRTDVPNRILEINRDEEPSESYELGARYSRPLSARFDVELIGLRQTEAEHFRGIFRSPAEAVDFALDKDTGETIGRGVAKFRQNDRLSWELGAETAFNSLESRTRFVLDGLAVRLPAADVRVEETRREMFLKSVWRPLPALTLEGSVRRETSDISSSGDVALEKTLTFTKPRLMVAWAPNAATQVRFRLERAVSQLDFGDFVANSSLSTGVLTAGNPDLEPEQAWVSELAVERRIWSSGAIVATIRHSTLSDVVDRAPVFGPSGVFDAPANIGEGVRDELVLDVTLPLDRVFVPRGLIKAQATWRRSAVTDPTTGQEREISGDRPVDFDIQFSQDLPAWRMNWGVNVNGGWRRTSYRSDQIDIMKVKTAVTPFVDWKPRPDLVIRAEIQNATERGVRRTRYVYSGPRSANGLAFVDDRDIQFGWMFYLRVRKTLGG